jgi:circadian clock protein KaiC
MTDSPLRLSAKAATGIAGLDEILQGGFPRYRSYLIQGKYGTGKTTLALQFLLTGRDSGETVLYFTMSETNEELAQVAAGHGWSLDGVHIHELVPMAIAQATTRQTVFPSAEMELDEMTEEILRILDTIRPQRVVFDSVTEIRLLATTPLRYRQQLLSLRQRLFELRCTTLLLSNDLLEDNDLTLDSLVHGVITLNRITPEYGKVRRRLEIVKLRGMAYAEGYHDLRIRPGGLVIYPRLQTGAAMPLVQWETLSSGITELDALVGGGLETGTACLLAGQAGTGKTTVAMLYAYAAVQRGEPVAIFLFDERLETWHQRATSLGMELHAAIAQGLVTVRQVDIGEISPGEFAHLVRQTVEVQKVKAIVIDSLSGYINAMPEETLLLNQMHELLAYLGANNVLALVVVTQRGVFNINAQGPLDLSYLVDTVLLLRHFEAEGVVRQAISVIKKRYGHHEKTIRELRITAQGVLVGLPLTAFSGILSGVPQYEGGSQALLALENQLAHPSSQPDGTREYGDAHQP